MKHQKPFTSNPHSELLQILQQFPSKAVQVVQNLYFAPEDAPLINGCALLFSATATTTIATWPGAATAPDGPNRGPDARPNFRQKNEQSVALILLRSCMWG